MTALSDRANSTLIAMLLSLGHEILLLSHLLNILLGLYPLLAKILIFTTNDSRQLYRQTPT